MASTPALADYVQLVARVKPAVVEIKVQTEETNATGTGFFVTGNGCVMTNWHVVSDVHQNSDVTVIGNDGTHYAVQGLAYADKEADLAILKCDCTDMTYLQPDPDDDVAEGQTILVIGNPKGFTGTVSNGIVSAVRKDAGLIQITAPVSPGSSGSPVLNEKGLVIGVVVGLYEDGQNINFSVATDKIRLAVETVLVKNAKVPPRREERPLREERGPRPVSENQEALDDLLNDAYRALRGSLDSRSQELLRREEIAWLKQRDQFRNDPDTFLQVTLNRIRLLRESRIRNQ
jgi:S1-C subfamily serine protease